MSGSASFQHEEVQINIRTMYNLHIGMRRAMLSRVLIVLAMLTLAVMYASFCATKCAFDDLPGLDQEAGDQHGSSGQSQDSHHDGPRDSGCAASDHLDAFVPATAVTAEFDVGNVGRANISATPVEPLRTSSGALRSCRASDLAPPHLVVSALYQQNSVLRI
jgi:hypothetical protein